MLALDQSYMCGQIMKGPENKGESIMGHATIFTKGGSLQPRGQMGSVQDQVSSD